MEATTLQAVQDFCLHVPQAVIGAIVTTLRQQTDTAPVAERCITACGLNASTARALRQLLHSLADHEHLATALETGAYMAKHCAGHCSFVLSGPVHTIPDTRKTEQVLLDIIQHATKNILLVSFAAYRVPNLARALHAALQRGVRVRLILETAEDSAGQLSRDARQAFDTLSGATFYHWPVEKRQTNAAGKPGKMHAKCAVNDDSFIITSANLTNDAICNNIELGLWQQDRTRARQLLSYFDNLIRHEIFTVYR